MSQTLLAVLALALASLLVVSATRSRLSQVHRDTTGQATIYATDAGLELLDHIRSRPFDAATTSAPVTDRSVLTAEPFETGGRFADAADVDDFNGMLPHTMNVGGLPVTATALVRYVKEDSLQVRSLTPTFAKEVTVRVWSRAFPDTLEFAQVVTYP